MFADLHTFIFEHSSHQTFLSAFNKRKWWWWWWWWWLTDDSRCFPYPHTYRLCKLTNIKKLHRLQTSVARIVLPNLSQQPATALLSELHWLPVNSRITFKLACLAYKLLTTGQPAYLRTLLHTIYTPIHALYSRLISFSSKCLDFPLTLLKDRLVTWLLQSGMDYLLTSDFHPLLTPSNAVWKLTFSSRPLALLPMLPTQWLPAPVIQYHYWTCARYKCMRSCTLIFCTAFKYMRIVAMFIWRNW